MKTIADIRRENLQQLIDRVGSVAELNERMGWDRTDPRLTRIRNANMRGDRGKAFQMGEALARQIESSMGVEEGWMDNVHRRVPVAAGVEEDAPPYGAYAEPEGSRPAYGHDYRTVAYSLAAAIDTTPGAAKLSIRAFLKMVDAAFEQLQGTGNRGTQ